MRIVLLIAIMLGLASGALASEPVAVEITGCVHDGRFVSETTDFGTHQSTGEYVIHLFLSRSSASGTQRVPADLRPYEGNRLRVSGFLSPGDSLDLDRNAIKVIGPCQAAHSGAAGLSGFDQAATLLAEASRAAHRHLLTEGSGLVGRYAACPGDDRSEWGFEFVEAYDIKPFGASSYAMLIDTRQCSGGNKHGQYFAVSGKNGVRLVLTDVIGDMRFIIERFHVDWDKIEFLGLRWLENDPHCCPSWKGRMTFDLKTGKTRFAREDY
ncbi:hypothetical protein ACLB6G_12345 [Zhengella sp. ZM62]|uniref:hypothetical protein n=1 Tax=Zhengella sedimenti TaxID=3390035 RepID=UPI003974B326